MECSDAWQARIHDAPFVCPRQGLAHALQAVAERLGVDVAQLQGADRSWAVSRQRTLAAYFLIRRGGYPAREVSAALHRDPATVSSLMTRFAMRLVEEPDIQRELERLTKKVKI